jgi:hypothetical protein
MVWLYRSLFLWWQGWYFTRSNDFYLPSLRLGRGGGRTLWIVYFIYLTPVVLYRNCILYWRNKEIIRASNESLFITKGWSQQPPKLFEKVSKADEFHALCLYYPTKFCSIPYCMLTALLGCIILTVVHCTKLQYWDSLSNCLHHFSTF